MANISVPKQEVEAHDASNPQPEPRTIVTDDGKKVQVGPADGGIEPDRYIEEINEDLDPA